MQNHLIQVMALLAMECPTSIDSKEMSLMKTKVLKETSPITIHDVVTGQYIASKDGKTKGYKVYIFLFFIFYIYFIILIYLYFIYL